MLATLLNWFRYGGAPARSAAPWRPSSSPEAVTLRAVSLLVLAAFVVKTLNTAPQPGFGGEAGAVLAALVVFVVVVIASVAVLAASSAQPRVQGPQLSLIALLLALTAASAVLAAVQPNGSWQLGPALVACFAAVGLARGPALATFSLAAVALLAAAAAQGSLGPMAGALVLTALPWFVIFRLLRELRGQRDALEVSQVSEARAAAAAERGRLVREMHDVLAHSLSALALQLESTRLVARDREADESVARAIDDAHALAANGLQEARRAIAAERGDEVPGPERIGVLADEFRAQSGIPVDVAVRGEQHELAPDARLALYRTAQEALTNIRRHATPEHVHVKLDYLPGRTVLVIEDHAPADAPPSAAPALAGGPGYGLTGMRERAELLGGRMLAGPTADGFRVELWLPLHPPVPSGAPA